MGNVPEIRLTEKRSCLAWCWWAESPEVPAQSPGLAGSQLARVLKNSRFFSFQREDCDSLWLGMSRVTTPPPGFIITKFPMRHSLAISCCCRAQLPTIELGFQTGKKTSLWEYRLVYTWSFASPGSLKDAQGDGEHGTSTLQTQFRKTRLSEDKIDIFLQQICPFPSLFMLPLQPTCTPCHKLENRMGLVLS